MALKFVFVCALAVLVQQTLAGTYYQSKQSCSCGAPKMSVTKFEEIEEVTCRPTVKAYEEVIYQPSKGYSSNSMSIEIPTSGGTMTVSSIGPITPSGIAVATDLSLAGDLDLSGVLPYLSAVAFEGQFAASGAAPVAYSCGDCVAITDQIGGSVGGVGVAGAGAYGMSAVGGCGCKY